MTTTPESASTPVLPPSEWSPGDLIVNIETGEWRILDTRKRRKNYGTTFHKGWWLTDGSGLADFAVGSSWQRWVDVAQHLRPPEFGVISDGFGSEWPLCAVDCELQVVRPGKVQCRCEEWTPDHDDSPESGAS